jgi:hypothetical protein
MVITHKWFYPPRVLVPDTFFMAQVVVKNNDQVEGQVNRLKFIKRQMYGRASFALL